MQIVFGTVKIDVFRKKIRNIHLTVHPPDGRVTLSAPLRTGAAAIRSFALSKLTWIKKQQDVVRKQSVVARRDYTNGEYHESWGRLFKLRTMEGVEPFGVEICGDEMILKIPAGADRAQRMSVLEHWYAAETKERASLLIAKWQRLMGVRAACLTVRPMKTRWGSCSVKPRSIRINSELARRAPEYLEYIVVHELAHLRVPSHNARFASVMDQFMPEWKTLRRNLNKIPPGQ